MNLAEEFLTQKLNQRIDDNTLRTLYTSKNNIDFCSNDYLGLANDKKLFEKISEEINESKLFKNGATGSRLLSGNSIYTETLEQWIADFHDAESGLIFNSGYDANVGLLSSIAQRNDTIICDELIHASVIDGARLSNAKRLKFKHNCPIDLEKKLKIATGIVYVCVESVYSMDGDLAPLHEIVSICKKYNAHLIVDEAHATGVVGQLGEGLVHQMNVQNDVFARVITFGKALGCHGAIVLGSKQLRNYLINFARSFIYTTALPIHSIVAIKCAYQQLAQSNIEALKHNISLYNQLIDKANTKHTQNNSAIQTIMFSEKSEVKKAASMLQAKQFDVKAILSPTVAKGSERLRICLHSFNTELEIKNLVHELKNI